MTITLRKHRNIGLTEAIAIALRQEARVRREEPRPLPRKLLGGPIVQAYVNHDRWVADCPFCTGGLLLDDEDPRFFCLSCHNEDVGGEWLPVQFPDDRGAIETALAERSRRETRNWVPGETVVDLLAQTLEREGR